MIWIRVRRDCHRLAGLQHRQFALVKLRPNPDDREIGDVDQAIADLYVCTLAGGHFLNDAAKGRPKRQRLGWLPRSLQFCDLFVSDIPLPQTRFGRRN